MIMRKVKRIFYQNAFAREYTNNSAFLQYYLEQFINQDINIIAYNEINGCNDTGYTVTIIYECKEAFIDKTGAGTVCIQHKMNGEPFINNNKMDFDLSEIEFKN